MTSPISQTEPNLPATAIVVQPSSPRFSTSGTPTDGAQRKIGIAVDLSEESAFAVKWAVQNYLRPGDAVVLVHVSPTNVLYGADWGAVDATVSNDNENEIENENDKESRPNKLENDIDAIFNDLAQPLEKGEIPYKIHVVKDHDLKERLCLEVERLGLGALITGSRGIGASAKRESNSRLGSVSDYCVHHCVCPVIVVRATGKDKGGNGGLDGCGGTEVKTPKFEEEHDQEYHDALDN